MVDMHLTPSMKTVGGAYSCFNVFAFIFISIGILFMLLLSLVILNPLASAWFKGGYWWLFILTPLAFILFVIMTACYMRKREDRATLLRNMNLFRALRKAEDTYLSDTGI
jgi:uncharacterized protein YacL